MTMSSPPRGWAENDNRSPFHRYGEGPEALWRRGWPVAGIVRLGSRHRARRIRRHHGPVGFRQIDRDEYPRLPRYAVGWTLSLRRRRCDFAGPRPARIATPQFIRVRVPGL